MPVFQGSNTARLARYALCAILAAFASGCGGDGGSSGAATTPVALNDTGPQQPVSPPTITGTPATSVVVGASYSFQPSASDTTGDALTFAIQNKPAWATFDPSSGLLRGTPAASDVGTSQPITISVADGNAEAQLAPFTIQVIAQASAPAPPKDAPPTLSGTPATSVQAGSHYVFQPSAADPDGDALVFSITNKPSWASFSTATGALSGTPASTNVGTYSSIVISVSDGTTSVALPSFAIAVTAIPAPPTSTPPKITGTPATSAQAGKAYSFTPAASSPSGKTLSFSVKNKPSWATFSIATGTLSGTPGSGDVGTDAGIVITVSDGSLSASLTAFTITVAAAAGTPTVGSATLHWAAPTQNTDGSPVTNLSGYVISYGMSANALSQTVSIPNPATTSYTIQNLGSGTWYFAVSSLTAAGSESALSSVVSKAIQ